MLNNYSITGGTMTEGRGGGFVIVTLKEVAFNRCHWNVCEDPETEGKLWWTWSWALPPRWTVSVHPIVTRLPCWSRHCCFLYWPLLWTASSPSPCCHPGCLGQSSETPKILGGTGQEEWKRQSNDGHCVSTGQAMTGKKWLCGSPWNAICDVIVTCHLSLLWFSLCSGYYLGQM